MAKHILNETHIPIYLELRKQNKTDEEIAKKYFGCSTPTVSKFRKRYNLHQEIKLGRILTEYHIEAFKQLRKNGFNLNEIANHFGVSLFRLEKWIKQNQLEESIK